jgi:hypothetical protein
VKDDVAKICIRQEHIFELLTAHSAAAVPELSLRLAHIDFRSEVKSHCGRYFDGLRLDVKVKFETFLDDTGSSRVFWIQGGAGIGKSTISGMLCNEYAAHVVAVFFCHHNDAQRKSVRNVMTTLAYQLSLSVPACGTVLKAQMKEKPAFDALNDDLATVITTLLIEPLSAIDVPLDGMSGHQTFGLQHRRCQVCAAD